MSIVTPCTAISPRLCHLKGFLLSEEIQMFHIEEAKEGIFLLMICDPSDLSWTPQRVLTHRLGTAELQQQLFSFSVN